MSKADKQYPNITLTNVAFGSCHKNKAITTSHQNIFPAIIKIQPQAFLWLGDAIYSPNKKVSVATKEILQHEYDVMLSNYTIGYKAFLEASSSFLVGGVHGTHDDHDYGANDYGNQMPDKLERKKMFLEFIQKSNDIISYHQSSHSQLEQVNEILLQRDGLYSSIEYGSFPNKVKVILLDTRSGRDKHCPIPSVGAVRIPFGLGSALGCVSRWITAGLNLQNKLEKCRNAKMLSEQQWKWLEDQVAQNEETDNENVSVYILGSSVQVLTTNPAVESWGHYPEERLRLLTLLNNIKKSAVIILSGDVHHGEILDSSAGLRLKGDWIDGNGRIIEITSSGLTHSCVEPFYGPFCGPILDNFPNHRYNTMDNKEVGKNNDAANNYYTGRNFGSIEIRWAKNLEKHRYSITDNKSNFENVLTHSYMKVNVLDVDGKQVLTTGLHPFSTYNSQLTEKQLRKIDGTSDGHLIPFFIGSFALLLLCFLLSLKWMCWGSFRFGLRRSSLNEKKKKLQ